MICDSIHIKLCMENTRSTKMTTCYKLCNCEGESSCGGQSSFVHVAIKRHPGLDNISPSCHHY